MTTYQQVWKDIPPEEREVIREFEKITSMRIPRVSWIVKWRKSKEGLMEYQHQPGYIIENEHIVGLGLCRIYRTHNGIKEFFREPIHILPKSLARLKYLKVLDLAGNDIIVFTDTFKGLSLETLILSDNNINSLPPALREMHNLRVLNISNNSIDRLPPWFGELRSLEWLDISKNNFRNIPPQLCYLERLKSVCLKDNPLNPAAAEVAEHNIKEIITYCKKITVSKAA